MKDVNWEIFWGAVESIATFGLFVWAILERRARKRADNELEEIKRRGDAPFLTVSNANFQRLHHELKQNVVNVWHATNGNVLSCFRDEVGSDMEKGLPVIFVVDNAGQSTRGIIVKLEGEEIAFKREVDFSGSQGLYFFEYPYDPEKRGKEQKLTFSFETSSGVQDTHIYITRHGMRFLKRINPALP